MTRLLLKQREPVKHFVYSENAEDDYGNPIEGFTESESFLALVSEGVTEELDESNRDRIYSYFELFMDHDTPLSEKDEVEVRGYRCSVQGLVQRPVNARTGKPLDACARVKWTEG